MGVSEYTLTVLSRVNQFAADLRQIRLPLQDFRIMEMEFMSFAFPLKADIEKASEKL